ncbi:MAG: alpha/beta hydrolase fold domain-containing protein, partial [Clostridia bacterium]|nr:alpha/beta hydrolase fold domain-containing protein [Clostridia bacterium]
MKKYTVRKEKVRSSGGMVDLLVLEPAANRRHGEKAPGLLWIHGGGYVVGMAGMVYMSRAMNLVKKYGAVVVAPEYRLAGKAPYPAALEDCYAALRYMQAHADELNIDADRSIMVGGESAGGGLTAALCMYARDRGEVKIAFQMPLYPMLDDRDTDSSGDNHGISWNTRRNHAAWKLYLSK